MGPEALVDLPNFRYPDASWQNVAIFTGEDAFEKAVAWVKEHLGGDDRGRISTITLMEEEED